MSMTNVFPPSKLTDADKATISMNVRRFLDQYQCAVAAKVGSTQNLDKRMKAKDYRAGPFTNRDSAPLITGLFNDVMVAEAEGFAKDEMERQLKMRGDNSHSSNSAVSGALKTDRTLLDRVESGDRASPNSTKDPSISSLD